MLKDLKILLGISETDDSLTRIEPDFVRRKKALESVARWAGSARRVGLHHYRSGGDPVQQNRI